MIPLEDLKERARVKTRSALEKHPRIPDDIREQVTLGIRIERTTRVFELYVPGERPEDAVVLATTTLDVNTGEGTVEVHPEAWVKLGIVSR